MSALTLAFKAPVDRFAAFSRSVAEFFAGISEGQEMARRYEELSRMSDAALAARGISREELPQAVVHGRVGR
jgi:uncharacterized protein YjiS (DUF1127 family)